MILNPNETTTGISFGDTPVATVKDGTPAIIMPGTKEHVSALEQIYGRKGPPEMSQSLFGFNFDPKTNTMKETTVAAKTGEIDGERDILVFRDHELTFPDLWLAVYVTGPPEDTKGFPQLFARASCYEATSIADADLVVFTGGPDVDPEYYGETRHPSCYTDEERDYDDIATYLTCLDEGIPMTGICRGAQFLAVMNGYKLYQHIDGHHGEHHFWDTKEKVMIQRCSSVHHQSVIPGPGMEILGVAHKSYEKWKNDKDVINTQSPGTDLEAFFLRDTCCICVQGHPEYRDYNAFAQWYIKTLYEYVNINPDLEWQDNCMRMKKDLLEQREEKYVIPAIQGE